MPGARRARQLAFVVFVLSNLWPGAESLAADKNGVSPNTISLPKGPGSIEGLGESFQPTLNTGTAKYAVALKLPPGTAGHAPTLALSYEGGGGNGPLGFGWQIAVPHVQRRCDEGMPLYPGDAAPTALDDWSSRYQTFINETREELVPAATGFYQGKNEGAFIRYQNAGPYWTGTTPDGTRLDFGASESARIQDGTNHVFRWLLERETDIRGNTIIYTYTNFPGPQNTSQKYLAAIAYGPGAPPWANFHFVTFLYEDRSDWFEDCRSGFAVRTGQRLKCIVIGTQGPVLAGHLQGDFNQDGTPDCLDRRYDLEYLDYAGSNTHWSLLSKLTVVGADGVTALPSMTLGYAVCEPPDLASATNAVIGGSNEPAAVPDNPNVEFIDLNGDGLPDLLRTYPGGTPQRAFLNRGEIATGATREIAWAGGVDMGGDALAASYALSSNSVHLADMDGDGLSDLVAQALNGAVFYFTNRATLQWGNRRTMTTNDYAPPSPFGSPDVRTADLDFDKRMDIVQSVAPGGSVSYRVWFNLGNNHYSQRKTVTPATGFLFSASGVHLADFNGDRLADIMQVRSSSVLVTVGLGYGRFAEAVSAPIDQTLDLFQIAAARMQDINGDGLADLVIERAEPGRLWYWINRGNYSFSPRKIIAGMPTEFTAGTVVRWADLNGDGATDLVYADSTTTPRLRTVNLGALLNGGSLPNILTAISNGIGRVTQIGYASSTGFAQEDATVGRPWPEPMPFPVSVVAAVTNLDSLGHQYVTQFRYHDGYYDPTEKQFRGFARVEQIEVGDPSAPTLITRSHFDTGRTFEAMKGRLLRLTTEAENGVVFSDTFTAWSAPPRTLYVGTNGVEVRYVHPVGRTNVVQELGQGIERRLESAFAYDVYGNQTTNADYGIVENGDRSAFHDERLTTTEYAINPGAWLIRKTRRQEIQDANGAVISRTEFYYDDETFSGNNLGTVTLGNLTMRRQWNDPASPAGFINSTRTQYDAYGNPLVLLDPLADAPGGAVNFNRGHARTLAYDARFHAYPVTETIHLGQDKSPLVFQATYDEGYGAVSTATDFNANITRYGYDALARLTSIVKPGDTVDHPTVEYDYALAVPTDDHGLVNYVETRQRDQSEIRQPKSAMYFISRQFLDGLGRSLMSKTEAEPETDGGPTRVAVKGATLFNARQRPACALNPFYSLRGGSLEEQLAFENVEATGWQGQFHDAGQLAVFDLAAAHKTFTSYDAALRERSVIHPDGAQRWTLYEPLVTKNYDENDTDPTSPNHDTPTAQFTDGLGRLVQVDEITRLNDDGTPTGDLRTWTTRYEYDLNDQLTRLTDAQNNVRTFAYDGLQRKTSMNDPDRGIMRWTWDEASNLIETTDAKGQRITCTYDGANRILTEDYHDEGRSFSAGFAYDPGQPLSRANRPDVAYFYDLPLADLSVGDGTTATARNTRGMLASVWDLSGEEHTSYDARGRIEWVVKRTPDPILPQSTIRDSQFLVSYLTAFDYDSFDRVVRLTYPDKDEVRYEYGDGSLARRILGGPNGSVISNLVYSPSDQRTGLDYGNGVRTRHAYDPRLRLQTILTERDSQPSTNYAQLVHLTHEFDGVSNVRAIQDCRAAGEVPAGDPRRNTQRYQYDDRNRLTRVQYSFGLPGTAPRNDGEINYRYDRIGNMLAQTSTLVHEERGSPLANLGEMDSGGAQGRWDRIGRAAAEAPGPHALTAIRSVDGGWRHYEYDANGNRLVTDGLTNTWDFKDRLVVVESATMRADYTYDSADRRVTKRVRSASSALPGGQGVSGVVYVNKYFEVREHDAPVKYVWNGDTRVARVTGSLSRNARVQRLRVWAGWNLVSLAVATASTRAQLAALDPQLIEAVFQWNPAAPGWEPVAPGAGLPAGTVLWLKATTNATLALAGAYAEPTTRTVPPEGDFMPGAGLEAWRVGPDIEPLAATSLWCYDAASRQWRMSLPSLPARPSTLPAFIAPGEAVFLKPEAAAELEVRQPSLSIQYFSHNLVGSVHLVTDARGRCVSEDSYFPFGARRFHAGGSAGGPDPDYRFASQEQDAESGLLCMGVRYYDPVAGRFLSAEPLLSNPGAQSVNPQRALAYAYARNNPVVFVDRNGFVELCDQETTQIIDTLRARGNEIDTAIADSFDIICYMKGDEALRGEPGQQVTDAEGNRIGLTGSGMRYDYSRAAKVGEAVSQACVSKVVEVAGKNEIVGGCSHIGVQTTKNEVPSIVRANEEIAKATPAQKKPPEPTKATPNYTVIIGPVTILRPPTAQPQPTVGQTHPDYPEATTDPLYLIEHPYQVGNGCEEW